AYVCRVQPRHSARALMNRLLHHWVTEQADARPASTAIVQGDSRSTYGELDTLSTQLARLLRDGGALPGDRVALLMPTSPMAMVGLLGICKAACVYVPLDAGSPVARLKKNLD